MEEAPLEQPLGGELVPINSEDVLIQKNGENNDEWVVQTLDKECLVDCSEEHNLNGNEKCTPDFGNEDVQNQCEEHACGNDVDEMAKSHEIPYIGMVFNSEREAYNYYNAYAQKKGFCIRNGWCRHSTAGAREMIARDFVCSKQGKKYLKDKRHIGKQVNRRKDSREDCKARLYILRRPVGTWVVKKFIEEHTHILGVPNKAVKLRTHSKQIIGSKDLVDAFSLYDTRPKINILFESGQESVISQQVVELSKKKPQSNIGNECVKVLKYFQDKSAKDPQFFFQLEVEEEQSIRSMFWCDGRSRDNYMKFGDVVMFDTTYRTNNWKIPFASFFGVNHHGQFVLFASTLLADETQDTFMWTFRTFLTCMCDKKPKVIITSEDFVVKAATHVVFEGVTHKFCACHIDKNTLYHVSELKCNPKFKHDYERCVHESTSPTQFENEWNSLKEEYPFIQSNTWLNHVFEIREQWVPCYLKDIFMAGITSSDKSESTNSFFSGCLNSHTPISEFVVQYDKAVIASRTCEEREDLMTMTTKPNFISVNPIERQLGEFYTRKIFTKFQNELQNSLSYIYRKVAKVDDEAHYHVWMHGKEASPRSVHFKANNDISISCSCKKFEHEGILCRHALVVLWRKGSTILPQKYILERWTLKFRYHTSTLASPATDRFTPLMLWNLQSAALKLVDIGSSCEVHYAIIKKGLDELIEKINSFSLGSSNKSLS